MRSATVQRSSSLQQGRALLGRYGTRCLSALLSARWWEWWARCRRPHTGCDARCDTGWATEAVESYRPMQAGALCNAYLCRGRWMRIGGCLFSSGKVQNRRWKWYGETVTTGHHEVIKGTFGWAGRRMVKSGTAGRWKGILRSADPPCHWSKPKLMEA